MRGSHQPLNDMLAHDPLPVVFGESRMGGTSLADRPHWRGAPIPIAGGDCSTSPSGMGGATDEAARDETDDWRGGQEEVGDLIRSF